MRVAIKILEEFRLGADWKKKNINHSWWARQADAAKSF